MSQSFRNFSHDDVGSKAPQTPPRQARYDVDAVIPRSARLVAAMLKGPRTPPELAAQPAEGISADFEAMVPRAARLTAKIIKGPSTPPELMAHHAEGLAATHHMSASSTSFATPKFARIDAHFTYPSESNTYRPPPGLTAEPAGEAIENPKANEQADDCAQEVSGKRPRGERGGRARRLAMMKAAVERGDDDELRRLAMIQSKD
jgi:hypothetical protein